MKCHVEKQDTRLSIRIEGLAGQEQTLLETIRQCRPSAWACPSGECLNIETIKASGTEGGVTLDLTAKSGVQLSSAAIEECLRYMLKQAIEK